MALFGLRLVLVQEDVGKGDIKMPFGLVYHNALQGFGNLVVILARPIFKARPCFVKKENTHNKTHGKSVITLYHKFINMAMKHGTRKTMLVSNAKSNPPAMLERYWTIFERNVIPKSFNGIGIIAFQVN